MFLHFVQIHSFQAIIAIIMLIPADIGSLLNFLSFTAWLFYGAVALALLILRYKWKDTHRPFKVCIEYVSLRLRVQNRRKKNGISHLISALCINCMISIPEYSRIIDYSIIWMCIWCGLLQKLYKIKKSELLNSKVYSKV